MIEMRQTQASSYPLMYRLVLDNEPFAKDLLPDYETFLASMQGSSGFMFWDGERLVAVVTFTHWVPKVDAVIHAVADKQYRGRWINRSILRKVMEYSFKQNDLRRLSGYAIRGLTGEGEKTLCKIGFECEGVRRQSVLFPDGYHDVAMYGILREHAMEKTNGY